MKALIPGIFIVLLGTAGAAAAQVAVVANPSVTAPDLDAPRLLDIYTGAIKTWSGGIPIVLLDQKQKTSAKVAFYSYLGMSASRLKSIWMKNLLSGEGTPPESIDDEDELLKRVAATPGALGYVSMDKARQSDDIVILLEIPEGER